MIWCGNSGSGGADIIYDDAGSAEVREAMVYDRGVFIAPPLVLAL